MGEKELLRGKVMELVKRGQLAIRAAAQELKASCRQGRRIYAAYAREGDSGLVHGNVGKPSNRKTAREIRERAVKAHLERYGDFGLAFAAEKLREAGGMRISGGALRRWLTAEGLRKGKRKRRACFGELIQFDGSRRDRFEGRSSRCCLITMTDDAANIRYARFFEAETAGGAVEALSRRIRKLRFRGNTGRSKRCIAAIKTPLRWRGGRRMRNCWRG